MEKFNISKIVANFRRKGRFSKEKRPSCGAASQIRTGDLVLTKRPRRFFLTIFRALWPYPLQSTCFPSLFKRKVSACSVALCGSLCGQSVRGADFRDMTVCTKVVRARFSAPPRECAGLVFDKLPGKHFCDGVNNDKRCRKHFDPHHSTVLCPLLYQKFD